MRSYISIEVRYAETDQMGVVHHSVYPVWFETARTRFSQEMGVPYQEMERMGLSGTFRVAEAANSFSAERGAAAALTLRGG